MWESLYGNVTKEEFKMGQDFGKNLFKNNTNKICIIGSGVAGGMGGTALGGPYGGHLGRGLGGFLGNKFCPK